MTTNFRSFNSVFSIAYQCPICKLPYMSEGRVKQHMKTKHPLPDGNPKKF